VDRFPEYCGSFFPAAQRLQTSLSKCMPSSPNQFSVVISASNQSDDPILNANGFQFGGNHTRLLGEIT
jgi:hypothetical protein